MSHSPLLIAGRMSGTHRENNTLFSGRQESPPLHHFLPILVVYSLHTSHSLWQCNAAMGRNRVTILGRRWWQVEVGAYSGAVRSRRSQVLRIMAWVGRPALLHHCLSCPWHKVILPTSYPSFLPQPSPPPCRWFSPASIEAIIDPSLGMVGRLVQKAWV